MVDAVPDLRIWVPYARHSYGALPTLRSHVVPLLSWHLGPPLLSLKLFPKRNIFTMHEHLNERIVI